MTKVQIRSTRARLVVAPAVVGMILALLASSAAARPAPRPSPGPASEQAEVSRRLDEVLERLGETERRQERLRAGIRSAQERRRTLGEAVGGLRTGVEQAQARLETASRDLAVLERELERRTARLQQTLAELEQTRVLVGQRASSVYRAGPVSLLDVVLGASNLSEIGTRLRMAVRVFDHDREQIRTLARLKKQALAERDRVAGVREEVAAAVALVRSERDRAAQSFIATSAELDRTGAEVHGHQAGLQDAQADRERFLRQQRELEDESRRIAALIRSLQRSSPTPPPPPPPPPPTPAPQPAAGENGADDPEDADEGAVPTPTPAPTPSPAPAATAPPSSQSMTWPAQGPVTSGYGWRTHPIHGDQRFHSGIDIGAPHGAPVVAAAAGTVIFAGDRGGYGTTVIVDHGDGLSTLYAHLSSITAGTGTTLSRGQLLGRVGCTGFCTGPHLHFEVRVNGEHQNPMRWLS